LRTEGIIEHTTANAGAGNVQILGEKTAFLKEKPSPSDLVDIIVK